MNKLLICLGILVFSMNLQRCTSTKSCWFKATSNFTCASCEILFRRSSSFALGVLTSSSLFFSWPRTPNVCQSHFLGEARTTPVTSRKFLFANNRHETPSKCLASPCVTTWSKQMGAVLWVGHQLKPFRLKVSCSYTHWLCPPSQWVLPKNNPLAQR